MENVATKHWVATAVTYNEVISIVQEAIGV